MKRYQTRNRLLSLLIDYIVSWVYLFLLFAAFMFIYFIIMDGIPEYSHFHAQWMAFLTTILPVTIMFSVMEYRKPYGTIGKKMRKLKVKYKHYTFLNSLLRNGLKFLPWHIGHIGVIAAIYNDYSVKWFMFANIGAVLAVIYILMAVLRRDHRHIPDLIAGTEVVPE